METYIEITGTLQNSGFWLVKVYTQIMYLCMYSKVEDGCIHLKDSFRWVDCKWGFLEEAYINLKKPHCPLRSAE